MPTDNLPIAAIDPAGKKHNVLDHGAYDALKSLPKSKNEQSGLIYQTPDGKFIRTNPITGSEEHFAFRAQVPPGYKIAGIWHTHVHNSDDSDNDTAQYFSQNDLNVANQLKVPSYIVFPDGTVRKYVPGQTKLDVEQDGETPEDEFYTTRGDPVAAPPPQVAVQSAQPTAQAQAAPVAPAQSVTNQGQLNNTLQNTSANTGLYTGGEVRNMSVEKVKGGYENIGKAGGHGVFKTKEEAEKQKAAMFANGFRPGKAHGGEVEEDSHKKILRDLLDKEASGEHKSVLEAIHGKAKQEAGELAPSKDVVEGQVDDARDADGDDDEDEDTKRLVEAFLSHNKS